MVSLSGGWSVERCGWHLYAEREPVSAVAHYNWEAGPPPLSLWFGRNIGG
jgi:hypothetical protein